MLQSLSVLHILDGHVREALTAVRTTAFDAVVIDLTLEESDPIDAVSEIHALAPDLPIVVTGPPSSYRMARQAMSEGAVDFLPDDEDEAAVLAHVVRAAGEGRFPDQHRLARHDPISGAVSSPLFRDRLAGAMARASRQEHALAVIAADIDDLASVNASLGHDQGDELLRAVALRLATSLRSVDTVGRLGGDEFMVLLESVGGRADAHRIATRLAAAVAEPLSLAGHRTTPTVCMGIALWPDHATTVERLRRAAQAALFRAQAEGPQSLAMAEALPRSQRNGRSVSPRG
jgi:diguanylate cyclase (GGDEF)-like protein